MLFKKNKIELKEAPLGYWEIFSYMQLIPKDNSVNITNDIFERVGNIEGIKIKGQAQAGRDKPGRIIFDYEGEEYEVGFYECDFTFPEYLENTNAYFLKEEMKTLKKVTKTLTIFMEFHKDSKKAYHLQLKLAVAMVPDLLAIIDESAEKLINGKWAILAADSEITPSSKDLFMVQAVLDESGQVWLHTHGLCRCGLSELEILNSNKENYTNHYQILATFASYLIDCAREFIPRESSAYVGMLSQQMPIVVTYLPWPEGIKEYKNLKVGSTIDRQNGHNSKSGIVFIYKNEEDEKNGVLTKINDYDNLWDDNPIFFISDAETDRMKALAMERFDSVKEAFHKSNDVIIKIGLKTDSKDNGDEHIWFELLEFTGDKFRAKLTQEPYDVKNIHKGDEKTFTVKDITDWIIYTDEFSITPESTYLLKYDTKSKMD